MKSYISKVTFALTEFVVRVILFCRYKYINIIWFCSNWLAMSNSCYNPFVYGLLNVRRVRVRHTH